MRFSKLVVCLFGSAFLSAGLFAQSSNLAYQLASVSEDVRLLDERIRMLQTEMEDLRRENDRLKRQLSSYENDSDNQLSRMVTTNQLEQSLERAIKQLEARDDAIKNEVIATFLKELEKVLKSGPTVAKEPNVKTVFPENYPKENGEVYTVKKGDTLSRIAEEHNSRVDWIQNANKIASAKHLQVGKTLFIPQK